MFNVRTVYINGAYVSPEHASVSVFDRGLMFGDGVYEVIPVFGGRLFRLPQHLERLERSLGAIRVINPHTATQWEAILARVVRESGAGDLSIYLQITRGVAARDHAFPMNIKPTVFAYAQPLMSASAELLHSGVAGVTLPDNRWQRCDIKATALLANVLLRQKAKEQDGVEAILVRDGKITEGAASNVFIVSDGCLLTPPQGPFILPGITRDLILELARAHNMVCAETAFSEDQLRDAQEVWMSSSTREILPITRVNGRAIGTGRPGPQFARMLELYRGYKQAFARGTVD
jgi:D-alanine transaminase